MKSEYSRRYDAWWVFPQISEPIFPFSFSRLRLQGTVKDGKRAIRETRGNSVLLKLRRPERTVTQFLRIVRNAARYQQIEHLINTLVIKSLLAKKVYVLFRSRQPKHFRQQRFSSDRFKQAYRPVTSSTYSLTRSRFSMEPSRSRSIGTLPFRVS